MFFCSGESRWATKLALRLVCSTAALTAVKDVWSYLVELKMLYFNDRTRIGISIMTSAADDKKGLLLAIAKLVAQNCTCNLQIILDRGILFPTAQNRRHKPAQFKYACENRLTKAYCALEHVTIFYHSKERSQVLYVCMHVLEIQYDCGSFISLQIWQEGR